MSALGSMRPKVGLVLGAGGVRGCAHGGVLEVLSEAGVGIDVVVGASIGAMFGVAVAAGLPAHEVGRAARETSSLDLLRFYGGRLRPTRSNPIARRIVEVAEGRNFEDLEIPFGVVATNMVTGEAELIASGPILPAIQASIALPLIARAVPINGSFYLDGGICDTIPVWAARQLGAEKTIAIRLGYNHGPPARLRGRTAQAIFQRTGRQRNPLCGSLGDQVRFGCRQLTVLNPNPDISRELADVTIEPDFEGLSPNSMFGASFSYWKGVEATRASLPQVQRLVVMPSAPAAASLVGRGDSELGTDEVIGLRDLNTRPLESLGGMGIDD